MGRIAIVTDSTANIPRELAEAHSIYVAPLRLIWDGKDYADGVELTSDEYFTRLRTSETWPTTTSAVQSAFQSMFEKLRGKVAGVVAITLSSDLPAAAYQSALIAKEVVGDLPIEVIDSRLSTVAFGLVVLAAARAAAEGAGMEEIVKVTRETMSKMHVFFTVGTLDYFKRTGRVSLPHGLGEEKVATKYILTFREGKVVPIERPRTRTQALQRVLELFEENVIRDSPLHVAVQHADSLEEAEELKNKIASRYQCAELWIANATPVMATHLSPGTVGVGFYNE